MLSQDIEPMTPGEFGSVPPELQNNIRGQHNGRMIPKIDRKELVDLFNEDQELAELVGIVRDGEAAVEEAMTLRTRMIYGGTK